MTAREAPCQNCSTVFDWSEDECPNCGWSSRSWVEGGRYGLQGSHGD